MSQIMLRSIVTPIGILGAVAEEGYLRYLLHFVANAGVLNAMRELGMQMDIRDEGENREVLRQAEYQIMAYFNGKIREFDLPTKTQGTLFQKRIWKAMAEVPYGQTISYRELAARAGHPQAIRAAGSACGSNPLPIIVPCHRITRADGSMGEFALGAEAKTQLLHLEKTKTPQRMIA